MVTVECFLYVAYSNVQYGAWLGIKFLCNVMYEHVRAYVSVE